MKSQVLAAVVHEPVKVLAIVLCPPLAVYMERGRGSEFWVNVVMTLLGYVPGVVHGFTVMFGRLTASR
jgi:uncharacterized membrane protein YqaE (UPF0057 family)